MNARIETPAPATCIVVSQARYDRFDYHEVHDPALWRFVFVLTTEFDRRFPPEHRAHFDRFVSADTLTEELLTRVASEEIALQGCASRVRIVCTSEELLLPVATVRGKLGMPGRTVADLVAFRDKIEMKTRLAEAGVRVPRFTRIDAPHAEREPGAAYARLTATLGREFIAKPIDGAGSYKTFHVKDECGFSEFLRAAGERLADYECEEYVVGEFHHCDSIVLDGEVVFSAPSRYNTPCLSFIQGKNLGSIILSSEDPLCATIVAYNRRVIEAIGARDTVTHLEFFVTAEGEIIFIEIAARPPGAEVVPCLEISFGVDLDRVALLLEMGEDVRSLVPVVEARACRTYASWMYFPLRRGTVACLHRPSIASRAIHQNKVAVGDVVGKEAEVCFDRAGSVIAFGDDYQALVEDFERLSAHTLVEFEA